MPKRTAKPRPTLTEYIMRKILGPPEGSSGGNPAWRCPWHRDKHAAMVLYPTREDGKQRFTCHACGKFGDMFDIIAWKYPSMNFYDRKAMVAEYRAKWRKAYKVKKQVPVFSSVGDAFLWLLVTKY